MLLGHPNISHKYLGLSDFETQILSFYPPFQVPVVPLQAGDGHPATDQMWGDESQDASDHSPESGIPILITWSYGGNNVAIQGSWDNWRSR